MTATGKKKQKNFQTFFGLVYGYGLGPCFSGTKTVVLPLQTLWRVATLSCTTMNATITRPTV